jgi:hypothetical protein
MSKRILVILLVLFITAACTRNRSETYGVVSEIIRGTDIQNIQVAQGNVLPPYGLKVVAEIAALKLRVSTLQKDTAGRLKDIQGAIDHISSLASENEWITLEHVSVNQVGGSYTREEISGSSIQNLDTSAITFKLTVNLAEHDYDLMESVVVFNDFLGAIELPETLSVQAVSVETELQDLEVYRSQLISQIYQELDSVQEEYGQSVIYEITGLYDGLETIQLSDTEYYIYLEPIISVKEF